MHLSKKNWHMQMDPNSNNLMQNIIDIFTLYSMLNIFNVNLGSHLLEPEVTALSLIIYNQNMIPEFLTTGEFAVNCLKRIHIASALKFFQRTEERHQ